MSRGNPPADFVPAEEDLELPSDRTDVLSPEDQAELVAAAAEALMADPKDAEKAELPPAVYDNRGNVRPHGTPGAVEMTYAERVQIAQDIKAETVEDRDELADVPRDADTAVGGVSLQEMVSRGVADQGLITTDESLVYDEDTLAKVYTALHAAGAEGEAAVGIVNELQNAGILFRERSPEVESA